MLHFFSCRFSHKFYSEFSLLPLLSDQYLAHSACTTCLMFIPLLSSNRVRMPIGFLFPVLIKLTQWDVLPVTGPAVWRCSWYPSVSRSIPSVTCHRQQVVTGTLYRGDRDPVPGWQEICLVLWLQRLPVREPTLGSISSVLPVLRDRMRSSVFTLAL